MYVIVKTEANKIYTRGVDAIQVEDIPFSSAIKMGNLSAHAEPTTHTMAWWAEPTLPDHFTLGADSTLVPSTAEAAAAAAAALRAEAIARMTLREQVAAGYLVLQPDQKIVGNQIVTKSLKEQIDERILILPPTQKLIWDSTVGYKIIEMSLTEQVAAGALTLNPDEKIVTNAEGNQQVVKMTLAEQVAAGLVSCAANQKIVQNADGTEQIVTMTLAEQVTAGIVKMAANQKIVQNADGTEQIVTMKLAEQVAAGLIKLAANEHIVQNTDGTEQIVTMTLSGQVAAGLLELGIDEKIVTGPNGNEQIVPKSLYDKYTEGRLGLREPIEYVTADQPDRVQIRLVADILAANLIATVDQGWAVRDQITTEIINKIGQAYSPGEEMKITKAYLEAVGESVASQTALNAEDMRVSRFQQMQTAIAAIKSEYAPLKVAVNERIAALTQGAG